MGLNSLPTADPASVSQSQKVSRRDTTLLPAHSSSLLLALGYHNRTLNPESPEGATRSSASLQLHAKAEKKEKSVGRSSLRSKLSRSLRSRSTSSVHLFRPNTPASGTDSTKHSARTDCSASLKTVGAQSTEWQDTEYEKQLGQAVSDLKTDFVSGARQMADSALSTLASLIIAAAPVAQNRTELWRMTVSAAKELSNARPSMSAAITSCLLRALDEVMKLWEALDEKRSKKTQDLADMARRQMVRMVEKRSEAGMRLADNFAERLRAYCRQRLNNTHSITMLTLSNSSTIRTCILTTLSTLRFLHLNLLILESRPRFEGASMASQILSSASVASRSRLKIRILPDCAVATAARDADLVLLGADRISACGDVSNKIGSLAATVCVKMLSPKTQVVAVSDVEKIAGKGVEEGKKEVHPASEMIEAWDDNVRRDVQEKIDNGGVEIFGEWFEWVPAEYIDGYVTENGTLDTTGVERIAGEVGQLKDRIFG